MTDSLYIIQEKLNKKLLNLKIEDLDKHKYNSLIRDVIYEVNTIIPTLDLREDNIITEFTKTYLFIKIIGSLNSLNNCFCLYLEMENDIFSNIEVSII